MAKKTVSVEDLVRLALLKVADAAGEAKLTGKDGGLFASASGANKDAIAECLHPEKPLLTVLRKEGKAEIVALAPAGFDRIARDLPEEKVGGVARGVATGLPAAARAEFLQATISRTPLAAAELTPLLEAAVASEKVEHAARFAAAAMRRLAEEVAKKALARALELFDERRQNRLAAIKREWEAEGGHATDLPPHREHTQTGTGHTPKPAPQPKATGTGPVPAPVTDDEKDFRRDIAKQLAETWRVAWKAQKHEGRDYLESAMWNVSGLKMIGEPAARVPFDGRYHESEAPAFTGDPVQIVRPGWLLEEGDSDFVALKAVVDKG